MVGRGLRAWTSNCHHFGGRRFVCKSHAPFRLFEVEVMCRWNGNGFPLIASCKECVVVGNLTDCGTIVCSVSWSSHRIMSCDQWETASFMAYSGINSSSEGRSLQWLSSGQWPCQALVSSRDAWILYASPTVLAVKVEQNIGLIFNLAELRRKHSWAWGRWKAWWL